MLENTIITGGSLLIATLFDAKTKKIPNFFNLFLILFGLYFSITIKDITLMKSLWIVIRGFIISYPLYYLQALGAGDVKLLIGISSFLSLNNWLMLILISLLLGGVLFTFRLLSINEFSITRFHYYRFTHFILWAYFILLILFKN